MARRQGLKQRVQSLQSNELVVLLLLCLVASYCYLEIFPSEDFNNLDYFNNLRRRLAQAPSRRIPGSCKYELGVGRYVHDLDGTELGNWSAWENGIDPKKCPVDDYASFFSKANSDELRDRLKPTNPLVFLHIGDSLDRYIMYSLAELSSGFFQKLDRTPQPGLVNTALHRDVNSCIFGAMDGSVFLSQFQLFGMKRSCSNDGLDAEVDSRWFYNTTDRVRILLPVEIIRHLPNNVQYYVLLSSSLWDLSEGCNFHANVTESYRKEYAMGIIELHKAVSNLLPSNAFIAWRTSPPVSASYDRRNVKLGRNRQNQQILNTILHATVKENELGVVVDWWSQAMNLQDDESEVVVADGRHYQEGAEIAFFNMWLNTVADWNLDLPLFEQDNKTKEQE